MSREAAEGPLGKGSGGREKMPWTVGRVVALVASVVIFFPFVYGISWWLFSTPINRMFHHPQQCTIESAGVGSSRSRSHSGSYFISIKTSDCGLLRFTGGRQGLTLDEVADRIDALSGRSVSVDVGYWQLPYSNTYVVGIEGLDLSK